MTNSKLKLLELIEAFFNEKNEAVMSAEDYDNLKIIAEDKNANL